MISQNAVEVIKAYFSGGNAVNLSTANSIKALLEAIIEVVDKP